MGVLIALVLLVGGAIAQSPNNNVPVPPSSRMHDDRFKTDMLVVVAHPDDETAISTYIARAVFDENRRVAIVDSSNGCGQESSEASWKH
jgi:hypothetical protein